MAVSTNNEIILDANGMDLTTTLFCGQSFSWVETQTGIYLGVAGIYSVFVRQQENNLILWKSNNIPLETEEINFWKDYFALDLDYFLIKKQFQKSKRLAECIEYAPGIRVLRQPFFDTLLCFIISQNNHIPRITSITKNLRETFGTSIGNGVYTYPDAKTLANLTPDDLACLRAGFRAKYLIDAAKKVASGEIQEQQLRQMNDDDARDMLTKIYGVGTKVADCVLLYSLGRNSIVPMDVWMKRAIAKQFRGKMPLAAKPYDGIAQQFIFAWARENLK